MTAIEIRPKAETRGAAPRRRPSVSRRLLVFGVLAAVILVVASLAVAKMNTPAPTPAAPAAPPALTAHGTMEPAARATIATLNGGVVRALRVRVGQAVEAGQVVAQVSTPVQTEMLVSPWRGTVMGLDARLGDTIMPGAVVATIGDLSLYRVETTDVDEYLISQIRPDQLVTLTVEALDGRKLQGVVETVALAQRTSGGVENYPVVIRLNSQDPDVRPGMSVRVEFASGMGTP